MLRLPMLRAGRPYTSLQTDVLHDIRTGEPVAEVSQAIPGMIARDQLRAAENKRALEALSVEELLAICKRAGELFANADLPLGDATQSPDDYVRQLASTTGMPEAMGRANMGKIVKVLDEMAWVLDGLTRGLDLSVLDGGWGEQSGRKLSYVAQTEQLGAVLPNNSPGVHSLWLPAIPLKVPVVLKPGRTEPWTPFRVAQAFLEAGCPPAAISVYPTTHSGGTEILTRAGRSLFFGDASTVAGWHGSGKVQVHGPGWSKIVLGADVATNGWREHLDLLVGSIAANGGRSCINASGIWTASNGREIAEAVAERLASIKARPLDDPNAELAAFADPEIARRISQMIDIQLHQAGAEDVTARYRDGDRVAEAGGCTFLLPTLIYCEDPSHPLAQSEFGFPFAAVVESGEETVLDAIGPTLIGTVLSDDEIFLRRALSCRAIDRLNLGAIPTYQISWDQPHEGNLFDHLYQQRAFQTALAS